jgi:hypothetical protein
MWFEDRFSREPQAYRAGRGGELECWGPLPPLPPPPRDGEVWAAPTPLPDAGDGDRMVVRSFPPPGPRSGTVVLVPPWKIRSARLLSGYVALVRDAGWRVWLLTPPHHLERTAAGARGGEGFVTLDLDRQRRVFEQLVLEIRVLATLARPEGPVGLLGLSLGALAAALASTAGEPLEHAALLAPPADLLQVLGRTPIGRRYRALATRAGAPLPEEGALRDAFRCFEPAARAPAAARLFIATGTEDAIVPPEGPLALAAAWGAAPRVYRRGHLSLLFACRALRRDLAAFLAAPSAPTSSPTPGGDRPAP